MVVLGMSASTVPMMSPSPQANSELEFVVSGLNNKNENTMRKQKMQTIWVHWLQKLNYSFNICWIRPLKSTEHWKAILTISTLVVLISITFCPDPDSQNISWLCEEPRVPQPIVQPLVLWWSSWSFFKSLTHYWSFSTTISIIIFLACQI